MEGLYALAFSALCVSTILGTRASASSFAFDLPLLASFAFLASCGATSALLSRWLQRHSNVDSNPSRSSGLDYEAVPLNDLATEANGAEDSISLPQLRSTYSSGLRRVRINFLLLILALCLRIEVFRRTIDRGQCTNVSYDAFIPFLLSVIQWRTEVPQAQPPSDSDDLHMGLYDLLQQRLIQSRYRYVVLTFIFGLLARAASLTDSAPRSTYICSASGGDRYTPAIQFCGTLLNILILYCANELLRIEDGRSGTRPIGLRFMTVAYAMIITSVIILLPQLFYYFFGTDAQLLLREIPGQLLGSLLVLSAFVCIGVAAALLMILRYGIVLTALMAIFIIVSTQTTQYAWNNVHPFPPLSAGSGFLSIFALTAILLLYLKVDASAEASVSQGSRRALFSRVPKTAYLAGIAFILLRFCLWMSTTSVVTYHPIDMLIWNADMKHKNYVKESKNSSSLLEAQENYRLRYKRQPPPGFERWYEYATSRNSQIIDDFDIIERDLLPFYSISPQEIRERTWNLLADDWNDVAGISIRGGKATVMDNVRPTHRWMVDGVARIIEPFGEYLPDMDLAFNINDEPRVIVPYEELTKISAPVFNPKTDRPGQTGFSKDRAGQWKPMPEQSMHISNLDEQSWHRIFYSSGNKGCPPSSPARSSRWWDMGHFCSACAYPHSLGAFLRNWELAADICHQPDLSHLHGFYTSPAAYKVSYRLEPVFSQSKSHGFNDILYPSAWNYVDKVKYDPPADSPEPNFSEKETTVFWRGATSEGISFGDGKWRGMSRQRFVHLANNPGNTSPHEPLLIPYHDGQQNSTGQTFRYEQVPAKELTALLPADMHIVDTIVKCDHRDCTNQASDFAPLVKPSDFQDHWKYKYLLDLDGAAFSGRFLPFLSSRSLPFKSALFREWWDDRLTPWQHFVPLDLRGQGFWATLAYFTGLDGMVNGRHVKMDPHEVQAERIATQGRDWAGQVLRKEDMEIYFFRLLLEWGRLTDDSRDSLVVG